MRMPLEGIRVLDWTLWQMGPSGTAWFGDMGAEVIKIEERTKGDPSRGLTWVRGRSTLLPAEGRNYFFETNNRGKKSLAIDLTKKKGQEVVYRLAQKSDVFVQNFRKGVAQRLKVDYKTLSQYNPRLIYASVSGFGPVGADSHRPALDYMGLARSGIMTVVDGDEAPPMFLQGGLADHMGGIMMSHAVLAALYAREKTGKGQELHISFLGALMCLLQNTISHACLLGPQMTKQARENAPNPMWNHYQCQDGKWLVLALGELADRYWPIMCKVLGIEELEKDPRFENKLKREENCVELVAIFDRRFATKPRDEWLRIMGKTELLFTPINYIVDVPSDPQVIANQYIQEFDHPSLGRIKMPTYNAKFSEMSCGMRFPAPLLGQHTEEILRDIGGYSKDEVVRLKEEEVI